MSFIIFAFILCTPLVVVNAGRGCCSYHGGQDYCDTTVGKWVCKDGTYSPSCKCEKNEDNNYTNDYKDIALIILLFVLACIIYKKRK